DGQAEEKIFNVAASDKRKIRDNALEPVGNTVNIKTGAYTNSIGVSQLSTLWSDPEFDPDVLLHSLNTLTLRFRWCSAFTRCLPRLNSFETTAWLPRNL
ncbi:MAG: DUF3604 domain-containing protein, partial [Halioglobus sp.]